MNKKIEQIGYALLTLLWFLGSQLIVGSITRLCVADYESFYNVYQYEINFIAQILCLGVLLIIDYKKQQSYIQRGALKTKEVPIYIISGAILYVISIGINMVLLPYFPGYEAIQNMFGNQSPVWRFIVIVIMAPCLEEYVFRGKIQGYLKNVFPPSLAIIGQALLFGSLHGLALQKIYASVIGIFLGFAREKTNKLQASIIMHMTVNFISWCIATTNM